MANSFSASFPEIWDKEQQIVFYKTNVAVKIADVSKKSMLNFSDVLNRTYRSSNDVQKYTRGTSITIDDKTDTNEYLTIDQQFATGFYVDDFDKLQNNYDAIANYAKDDGIYLSNQVDAAVLWEVFNATSTVDDGTLGGTSGNGIALTTSNVLSVISAAKKKMQKLNIPMENLYGVISPEFEEILVQYGAGRDTNMGDKLNENGYIMDFYGFKLYRSNQLAGSAVLQMATDPSNTNTVVINGVTFTAVTTIGTTAGNFLVGSDADTSRAVLTAFINNPGTTSANQVALSAADQRKFYNITATNDASANTMTIKHKGAWVISVSETLAAAADVWTPALQKQHNLFGVVGNPVLIMQADPSVRIREVETKLGVNVLNGVLYWVKTYSDNAKQMVNVEIQSSGF